MSWKYGRQTPDPNLMRFVASRFGWVVPFNCLDIGSGEGANARELEERGELVYSIDKDAEASYPWGHGPAGHVCADICEWETELRFDLIYDINTLCHVENPPFEKIKSWLKPDGYFFSICPTSAAPPRVKDGKSYTRLAEYWEVKALLSPIFRHLSIYNCSAPDFRGNQLVSWIVEARP